jgi:hypothetical protein
MDFTLKGFISCSSISCAVSFKADAISSVVMM